MEASAKYLYLCACMSALRQFEILSSKALITGNAVLEKSVPVDMGFSSICFWEFQETTTKSAIPNPFMGISRAKLICVRVVLRCKDLICEMYARAKARAKLRSVFFREALFNKFFRGSENWNFGIFSFAVVAPEAKNCIKTLKY